VTADIAEAVIAEAVALGYLDDAVVAGRLPSRVSWAPYRRRRAAQPSGVLSRGRRCGRERAE
jgi:hypothetical protein